MAHCKARTVFRRFDREQRIAKRANPWTARIVRFQNSVIRPGRPEDCRWYVACERDEYPATLFPATLINVARSIPKDRRRVWVDHVIDGLKRPKRYRRTLP